MKILICGATGYLGKHIAAHLKSVHEVWGLARSDASEATLRSRGITPVRGDLLDVATVLPALDQVDAVVSIAQLMLSEEREATQALLEKLKGSGKTFIMTSGTGVLSQRTDGDWSEDSFAEDEPFVPSKYIGARLQTENMVRAAASDGVRAMVMRPPVMWGHGECMTIEAFYRSAQKTGNVCYVGRGLNLYSTVHVDDLAHAYALAIEKGTPGALYHTVSGELNYRTMAETIARHLGVPARSVSVDEAIGIWDKFTALVALGACSRSRSPRARRELGWQPSPDKLDLMAELVNPAFKARMTDEHRPYSAAKRDT